MVIRKFPTVLVSSLPQQNSHWRFDTWSKTMSSKLSILDNHADETFDLILTGDVKLIETELMHY